MKVRVFKNVRFRGDWEINFIGKRYNLRIGRSQLALWKNYHPVFNWVKGKTV